MQCYLHIDNIAQYAMEKLGLQNIYQKVWKNISTKLGGIMGKIRPFYLKYLQNELDRRIQDNPCYSLRAFAKWIEIDPSLLSKILARKQALSIKKADHITKKLHLDSELRQRFMLSVAEEASCISLAKADVSLTSCDDSKHK
jgi:plasmid maintenance system antidote protein VapI